MDSSHFRWICRFQSGWVTLKQVKVHPAATAAWIPFSGQSRPVRAGAGATRRGFFRGSADALALDARGSAPRPHGARARATHRARKGSRRAPRGGGREFHEEARIGASRGCEGRAGALRARPAARGPARQCARKREKCAALEWARDPRARGAAGRGAWLSPGTGSGGS